MADALSPARAYARRQVKKALEDFKRYAVGVVKRKNELNANDQCDVAGYLRKEYDFVQVRSTFNALEAVFDPDASKRVWELIEEEGKPPLRTGA